MHRGRQHSGIGGHEDFVTGAGYAPEGRSLICLPATARTPEGIVSRIVAGFAPGSRVTTPRHQVDVVITEFGAAKLAGLSVGDRAAALVEIAHPAVRDALRAGVDPLPPISDE